MLNRYLNGGLNDEKYKGNKGFEEDKKGPDLFWPKLKIKFKGGFQKCKIIHQSLVYKEH